MTHEHEEFEPIYGLPEVPPDGEEILWQGEPDSAVLARTAFFRRALVIYFAVIIVVQLGLMAMNGADAARLTASGVLTVGLAGVGLALATLFGWLYATTTVYTITNRRIAIRFGVAVTLTVNLPFSAIESVDMKRYKDGSGDLVLDVDAAQNLGFVELWPMVQWTRLSNPRPTMRGLKDVAAAADVLGQALGASLASAESAATVSAEPAVGGERAVA